MRSFESSIRTSVVTAASVCALVLALTGCDNDEDMDAGTDAAMVDSGMRDAGRDGGPTDGGVRDGGVTDGGGMDGAVDGGGADGGAMDGGGADGGAADAGADAEVGDAGPVGGGAATSAQIQAVRDAAEGAIDLMITGAIVTYLKPAIGTDAAGFFLQAEQMGPAIFVAIDPSTLTPAPMVGDVVDLRATDRSDIAGVSAITMIDTATWMVESSGHDVSFLAQDVTSVDVVSMLDALESELITVTARPRGILRFAGTGFQQISIDTAGLTGSDAYTLRIPDGIASSFVFETGCDYVVRETPLWRLNDNAQVSAFSAAEITRGTCDAPVVSLADALNERSVVVRFNRVIDATSVMAGGSQFTITDESDAAVAVTGAMAVAGQDYVIVTTGADLAADEFYTITVAATVLDTAGTGVDATMNSDTFAGYTPHLVINEVDYDQPSGDDAEFVEIFNPGTSPISLTGMTLYTIDGTGGTSVNDMVDLTDNSESLTELAGGGYIVVLTPSSSAVTVPSGVATIDLGSNLQNGPDGLVLRGTGGPSSCQDSVFYEGTPTASFMGCTWESSAGNDDGAAESLARIPNGADSGNNSVDFRLVAPTPGAANEP